MTGSAGGYGARLLLHVAGDTMIPEGHERGTSYRWEVCMRTGESERPITFAGTRLGRYRHVCAFFNTRDEEYRVFLPFI